MSDDKLKDLVTEEVAHNMWELLTKLMMILRWSNYIADFRYCELNKQSLNATIAYLLAAEGKAAGLKIDFTRIPKIIINRMFEKSFLCDIREDYLDKVLRDGNIKRERFDQIIMEEIKRLMGDEFANFIHIDKSWLETEIFRGATKIATKMEIEQIQDAVQQNGFQNVQGEIGEILNGYNHLPGFARFSLDYSNEMTIFKQISALRNRIRWQMRLGPVKCSVLGHNFEVAIISYLLGLWKYGNEEIATRCFFIGVFHDVPETFTGDVISPVKDAIPGLRQATELFEMEMMEQHIFSKLPEHLNESIHMVMMEEYEQQQYKPLIKQADYMSAAFECLRNLKGGSKDHYFKMVIERDLAIEGKFEGPFKSVLIKVFKQIL